LERPRQRACRAFGAQPQIRSKQRAGRMRLRKCFENLVSQSIEKLMVRNVRRELAFVAVEKKKVDVRTVVEFSSAEFPERENGNRRFCRAVTLPQLGVPKFEHATKANLCDL